jgi:hypothetical protein
MKSNELAHVLIKVMGLYICVWAIPGAISGLVSLFPSFFIPASASQSSAVKAYDILFHIFSLGVGYGVQLVV